MVGVAYHSSRKFQTKDMESMISDGSSFYSSMTSDLGSSSNGNSSTTTLQAANSSVASSSSLLLPLDQRGYQHHHTRHGCSDSDLGSAKVSDFELADSRSGSVQNDVNKYGISPTFSEEGSDQYSAQVSDQSSTDIEDDGGVREEEDDDEEEEEEEDLCSELESQLSISGRDPNLPSSLVPDFFLTQGKQEAQAKVKKSGSDLIQAARTGDINAVKTLTASSSWCNLNAVDSNGRTALHIACSFGRLEIMQLLVEAGANVDICSSSGQTPLHEACISGRYEILQEMLSEVADLDMVDNNGLSAAHYCALNGEVTCLSLLCNQGCDICLEDNQGQTGVHLAAMRNHPEIIQCLMERGMELDTADHKGKTPAHYAAKYGNVACLQCLAKSAVDMTTGDNNGNEPIHDAAASNSLACLQFLLKKGTKMTATNNEGQTPLHKASQYGALTCLHWLLEKGLNPNATDKHGLTGLHHAASGGHSKCFHCLLQHGANSLLCSLSGDNPLDVARKNGKPVAISRAVDGIQCCAACVKKKSKAVLESKTRPTALQRKLISDKKTLFLLPRTGASNERTVFNQDSGPSNVPSATQKTPKRNLATKYYGPPLYKF